MEQYITDRATAWNHYYIDADGVLWGSGYNQNGQLGNGSYETDLDLGKMDAVRIADHVVSVDRSDGRSYRIYRFLDLCRTSYDLGHSSCLFSSHSSVLRKKDGMETETSKSGPEDTMF